MNRAHVAAVLLALAGLVSEVPDALAQATRTTDEPPTLERAALLVGCTEYPALKAVYTSSPGVYESRIRLAGPANDVDAMREVLISRFGFSADLTQQKREMTILTGWPDDVAQRPTAANIRAALARLAAPKGRSKLVVVYYAGHGGRVPDRDGDEPDGLDEALMPADVTTTAANARGIIPNALTDDELGVALGAIDARTDKLLFIVDACHSNTMLRDDSFGVRMRELDPELLGLSLPTLRGTLMADEAGLADADGEPPHTVALYAAQAGESAPELGLPLAQAGRKPYGAFTFALAHALMAARADLSFRELYARLLATYRSYYNRATPDIEGDMLDAAVFGSGTFELELHVVRHRNDLKLDGGALHGVSAGDVLGFFAPDAPLATRQPLGYVEVRDAGLTSADCVLVDFAKRGLPKLSTLDARYPIEHVQRNVGSTALPIFVVDAVGAPLPHEAWPLELKNLYSSSDREANEKHSAWYPLAASAKDARCIVHVRSSTIIELEPFGSGGTLPRYRATHDVPNSLRSVRQVQTLLRFVNDGIAPPAADRVAISMRVDDGHGVRDLRRGEIVRPGWKARIALRNLTAEPQFLYLFFIDGNYGVEQIFPRVPGRQTSFFEPTSPRLEPNAEHVSKDATRFSDGAMGNEYLLAIAMPAADQGGVPYLLALESHPLRSDRSPTTDPLTKALFELLDSTTTRAVESNGSALGGAAMTLIAWRTGWGDLSSSVVHREPRMIFPTLSNFALASDTRSVLLRALPAAPDPIPNTAPELFASLAPSVVIVTSQYEKDGQLAVSRGTGVVIDARGWIVTNHHVISEVSTIGAKGYPRAQVFVGRLDSSGVMRADPDPIAGDVVMRDPERDLALIKLDAPAERLADLEPVPLAPRSALSGEECISIGHPSGGLVWSLRKGSVSGRNRFPDALAELYVMRLALAASGHDPALVTGATGVAPREIVQTDFAVSPGNSGGPLVDSLGRLIAVTFAGPGETNQSNVSYHVDVSELREFLANAPKPGLDFGPAVPNDAWDMGAYVHFLGTDPRSDRKDVLVANSAPDGEGVQASRVRRTVMMVLDDTLELPKDEPALAGFVATKKYPWQLALQIGPSRCVAWYDSNWDGTVDFVLIDEDGDRVADQEFKADGEGWIFTPSPNRPWLQAAAFEGKTPATKGRAARTEAKLDVVFGK